MIVLFLLRSIRIINNCKQLQQLNLLYQAVYKSDCIKDNRLFISTNEGNLFTHVIDKCEESELIVVETVLTGKKGVIYDMLWTQDCMFLSYDDGSIMVSKLDE
jgi:hypothetical protein